jgi:hypothetical protein
VDEIAASSVKTELMLLEMLAFLCFVLPVCLTVSQQLVRAVGEFTPTLVWAEAEFHVTSAKLCLLL